VHELPARLVQDGLAECGTFSGSPAFGPRPGGAVLGGFVAWASTSVRRLVPADEPGPRWDVPDLIVALDSGIAARLLAVHPRRGVVPSVPLGRALLDAAHGRQDRRSRVEGSPPWTTTPNTPT
jgi:hypothetical protein